ncbi:hypothetical protein H9P43_009174 [Blastocladiella emersonii ATCC 22665]|nr:hypothetical protein H9P43_009174 [Blastocladiella emersonii ATCC 22665]
MSSTLSTGTGTGSGTSTPRERSGSAAGLPAGTADPEAAVDVEDEDAGPKLTDAEAARVRDLADVPISDLEAHDAEVVRAIALFFDNDFKGALAVMQSQSDRDALYALGEGTFSMLKAMTTFDPDHIATATTLLQRAEALASTQYKLATPKTNSFRLTKWIRGGASYLAQTTGLAAAPKLTPGQLRSTIVRAEASLISSFLYLFQESLMAFVKAGLGLRKSQTNYAQAWQTYQALADAGGDAQVATAMDQHTREGIQFGIGALNVVLAILPSKVARVISILGYKGDRDLGFGLIEKAAASDGVRAPIATLFMGGYHAVLSSFAPSVLGPAMLPVAARHLTGALRHFPRSPFHLLLLARVARTARDLPRSDALLHAAQSAASGAWPELALLAMYEEAVNAMAQLDWSRAADRCAHLRANTYWSVAFFTYAEAACRAMAGDEGRARELMKLAPTYVTRKYGGKVISVEQWILKKAAVFEGRESISEYLPGFEILLIWNMFATMPHSALVACRDRVLAALDLRREDEVDALAVLHLVLATVERELGNWEAAGRSLEYAVDAGVEVETWVPPFATYARAVTGLAEAVSAAGDGDDLREAVQKADADVKRAGKANDYCFEFRLAFRIHLVGLTFDEWLARDGGVPRSVLTMPTAAELFGDS